MLTKKLFVLISDGGDGSYSAHYTMDEAWITKRDERDDLEHGELGVDGDGFHYDVLMIPEACTYESLGITNCAEDFDDEPEEDLED